MGRVAKLWETLFLPTMMWPDIIISYRWKYCWLQILPVLWIDFRWCFLGLILTDFWPMRGKILESRKSRITIVSISPLLAFVSSFEKICISSLASALKSTMVPLSIRSTQFLGSNNNNLSHSFVFSLANSFVAANFWILNVFLFCSHLYHHLHNLFYALHLLAVVYLKCILFFLVDSPVGWMFMILKIHMLKP